ncbi:MAG TPA: sugar ABC transporter permease [Arachnia sp.]|jgi:multiple sugar transport system permease protein|nr:sugar ABC transporter permease [Arachnia sp.]
MTRTRTKNLLVALAFLAPAAIYIVLFYGYPIVRNLTMSFQEFTAATFFTGEAPWVGMANYAAVLADPVFAQALRNTFIFTVASILGQFVIGMMLAIYFTKKFPLSSTLRSLLLLPWLIPMIVSSTIWRWILDKDSGVLNQFLSALSLVDTKPGWLTNTSLALISVILVNIWIGIPFNALILYGGLQDIPEELYEAAALDGVTGFKRFWTITFPLLKPVVNVVLVLGVVYTLKVLDVILGLTGGGPANATQTLATQTYQLSFVIFDFGRGAAVSNILIAISLVFAFIYLRANRKAVDE